MKKKRLISSILFSLYFTFSLVMGCLCKNNLYNNKGTIFQTFVSFKYILSFIIIFALFFILIYLFLQKLVKFQLKNKMINLKKNQIFLLIFISIIILWLPYFLSLFPGTLSLDSFGELKVGLRRHITHDSQPFIHQLFIMICSMFSSLFSNKHVIQ